jgi:hypothetical protein
VTVLRLTPVAGTAVGPALATIERAVLVRRAGGAYAQVPTNAVEPFTRALAFAGIAAERGEIDLAPTAGSLPARALSLSPLAPGCVELDVVRLERVPLGRATREVLRKRLWGALPARSQDRARCRSLLRHETTVFAWARRAWASRDALRSRPARGVLRPIVFGRDADRWDLDRRTTDGSDELARWLFA